ncbi:MAG: cytochrome c biogenesis protein CcsA [Desulfovibrionaceae bacterium]|jgi:ABC-type transport system involved in cytochrome c biogenesis permease subunit|nr:cytochrome c biogenesis protein CcsA [Desulfovibrionaceae bacterium]
MAFVDLLRFCVIALYLLGTATGVAGFLGRRNGLLKTGLWANGAGFAAHTLLLVAALGGGPLPELAPGLSLQMLSWCLLAVYFMLLWRFRLPFISIVAPPLALAAFVWSLSMTAARQAEMPKALVGLFLGLHIGSLFACFGLMAIAAGAGMLFLHLNRKIKGKEKLTGFRKDLPALSTFDRVNHVAVVSGFPLYTLGLISGFVWAKLTWGRVLSWDPKEVVALVIWFVFAFLFHQRLALGWKGRKPARLAVWIFVFILLSLVVINIFVPTHHSFTHSA